MTHSWKNYWPTPTGTAHAVTPDLQSDMTAHAVTPDLQSNMTAHAVTPDLQSNMTAHTHSFFIVVYYIVMLIVS